MSEQHSNHETDDYTFLREKIKERPINKRKVFKQSLLTITLAVTFALVACFIFFFFEKGALDGFKKEQDVQKIHLNLQETTEEILPEDMIIKEEVPEETEQPVYDPEEETAMIAEAIAAYEPDIDDYQGIYSKMRTLANETNKSLVSVIGIQDKTNWLNTSYENKTRTSGIIIEDNGTDLFILTKANIIGDANEIVVSFFTTQECTATVKSVDENSNLAILTVPLANIPDTTKSAIKYAAWGNSKFTCKTGDLIIAIGDPLGYGSSIGYGVITSTGSEINGWDQNFALITTDIYGSSDADGVLINKSGKIVGIINQEYNRSEYRNLVSAIGITELSGLVEDLCNDVTRPHMGVSVTNVPTVARNYYNVPMGAYITDIKMDSPAMDSGIHKGDVITAINDAVISSVLDYEAELLTYKPGDNIVVTIMRPSGDTYLDMDIKVTLSE